MLDNHRLLLDSIWNAFNRFINIHERKPGLKVLFFARVPWKRKFKMEISNERIRKSRPTAVVFPSFASVLTSSKVGIV
jgi:hypothetical protein